MINQIKISEVEERICKFIAQLRNRGNLDAGVHDSRVDQSRSSFQINLDGFRAEISLAKMCNFYPDFSIVQRSGGYDVLSRNGKSIDVKANAHAVPWLVAKRTKKIGESDYYVVIHYDGPVFTFVGWATEYELLREENLKDWGYGKGKEMYSLPPDKLHTDMAEFNQNGQSKIL